MRLSVPGVGFGRDEDTVREDLDRAPEMPEGDVARPVRDCELVVDPVGQEAPRGLGKRVPAKILARRVRGGDDRAGRLGERVGGDDRGQRLVHMEDVEALLLERTLQARHGPGGQDDVRKGSVGRDDHRPPDRDHVFRRPLVTPLARVEHLRQAPGRVVPDQDPGLVSEVEEGPRLVVGVLGDASPEGPGKRDDDPDLHGLNPIVVP